MIIDFNTLTPSERYFAMVQSIVPRPIAWVLSDSGCGEYNLAPFSFFTGICSDPALLMLSVGKKTTGKEQSFEKDTRLNIKERKYFVVHIASTSSLDQLNNSAATLEHQESELKKFGIKTMPFDHFPLPRLEEAPIALGCELYRMDEIGNTPQAVIYGEIKTMYVNDEVIQAHESRLIIDADKLDPLARLGGSNYSDIGQLLSAKRPK